MVETLVVWPGVLGPCLLGLLLPARARLLGSGVPTLLPDLAGLLSLELEALGPVEGRWNYRNRSLWGPYMGAKPWSEGEAR